jgi:hypothetical protein
MRFYPRWDLQGFRRRIEETDENFTVLCFATDDAKQIGLESF